MMSQRQLRNDSGAVLREVQAGQTLVVTRNGVPVAELRPVPLRRFVPRAAIADVTLAELASGPHAATEEAERGAGRSSRTRLSTLNWILLR